jgi:molecular chaperone HscB
VAPVFISKVTVKLFTTWIQIRIVSASMDLTQNYYQLFNLPQSFLVDQDELAKNYRQLQRELHPDKFASKSASEQRMSVQFTSLVNGAYQTLKSPLLSAEYLLELAGHPVNSDSFTIDDGEFLFKQMEWREHLADLSHDLKSAKIDALTVSAQLDELMLDVIKEKQQLIDIYEKKYNDTLYDEAKQCVAKLHFVEKMFVNINHLEDDLIV